MLKRVLRAVDSIKLATDNELDLLDKEEYSKLKLVIQSLRKA